MQTFLPYPDFKQSAQALDYRRLGKQRVEAYQIIKTIKTGAKAWSNHPAVKMWRGYTDALAAYMDAMILEWVARGYNNTMELSNIHVYTLPTWFGNPRLHSSHRAALLYKAANYYNQFGWQEQPKLDYWWPVG